MYLAHLLKVYTMEVQGNGDAMEFGGLMEATKPVSVRLTRQ